MIVVAAVDIGTNSTRLLVGDDRRTTITRLGQGVDRTGRLDPEAVERTLAVLREYGDAIRAAGAERVRAVATSAVRDAANGEEFLDAAAEALGTRPELLSGEEEGRLSFLGATAELDPAAGPFLVFDIGGGSTELVVGTTQPEGVVSLDTGAVRLTEQWLHSDPPTAEELSMAVSVARTHVEEVGRLLPAAKQAKTLVGLAGTVTSVAAVELGYYDRDAVHHFRLTRAAAEDVFRTLATESLADRRENPGLDPARADVIVGGCCVLVAILRHFDVDEVLVSETDILDGIIRSIKP
ncbi:MAG: Ppx/GppA phosphatase family [Actinomycetia bacterium]|nr:Ppx/GppA phosphatase family [Actinomycetes bacterium]